MTLRLGTRGSRLALAQSESVAAAVRARGADVEVVPIRTSGDRLAQVALADFGGKALFVKELEDALVEHRVDLAVHSLKDMPAELPHGLVLAAFPRREDARDVLLTRTGATLDDLAPGSVVGSSSLRRRVLVLARRPDLRLEPIRGNVDTRLEKLEAGVCDAVVIAKAGLDRLGLALHHAIPLAEHDFVPAVGQGTLAVEAREADRETLELLAGLDDTRTKMEALAERAFLRRLGASCHTPVAGHATVDGPVLAMTGLVASLDGRTVLRATVTGEARSAERIGMQVADDLLGRGARTLLDRATGERA